MKKEEFIDKIQETINKLDKLCGGFDYLVISGDPDCDCDYGVDERGNLIIDGTSTNLPVEDLENIRYRAKSGFEPSENGEFYIAFHFKNNLSVYYNLFCYITGDMLRVVYGGRSLDLLVSWHLVHCYDYHWGDSVAVNNDTLVAYLGNEEELTIDEGIKTIDYKAFENSKTKRIHLSDSVEQIESFAFNCSEAESIDLNNVKVIKEHAFNSCRELTHIVLPASLISIEKGAFSHSGITDLKQIDNRSSIELGDWLFEANCRPKHEDE